MQDVADLAGVSRTTVSFVINDREAGISTETKEKVLKAARQLGYRPNALAQGLRSQRSGLIGFITDEIAITPYAGQIFEGAQDAAWEDNKVLLLVNHKRDQDLKYAAIEMLLERQVEGIIYATMYHRPVEIPDTLATTPLVLLDCYSPTQELPRVVPDEVGGAYTVVTHLIEAGHNRIGFATNFEQTPATVKRLEGYKKALAEADIAFDPSLVVDALSHAPGGYEAAIKLLNSEQPPSALFCFNDRMAFGAYNAIKEYGLSIPDDIAVAGFDNQKGIAEQLLPPLTTVQLPHYEMGWWAAQYLLSHLNGEHDLSPKQHLAECVLVIRDSV